MATKDATSNAAREAKGLAAERRQNQVNYEAGRAQQYRQRALELAMGMCPPEYVRTAEALTGDAAKLADFMLTGKVATKPKRAR